jgi:serine protease Do
MKFQTIAAFLLLLAIPIFADGGMKELQNSLRDVAKKVLPVVVEINVNETGGKEDNPDFYNNQQQQPQQEPKIEHALGSGIIVRRVDKTYYVLTNNHVVGNALTISIKLQDQTVIDNVKLIGKDERRDLALVSFISDNDLPIAALGDSDTLEVGDIVLAIGNPLGFENTVTMGIVSALGRSGPIGSDVVASNTDYIQTDAAINQGNSGGALVNLDGEVVGINTWIAAPNGGSIGLGFSIPINNAKKVINDFIDKGKAIYGWLGAQIIDTGWQYLGIAKDLQLGNEKGAMLLGIYRNSPADRAGLLPGDFITKINGQTVTGAVKLTEIVGDLLANQPYDFELIRNGSHMKVTVRPTERLPENDESLSLRNIWPGMMVTHINDQIRQQFNDANIPATDGIMVASIAAGNSPNELSPAAIAGLKVYDMILQVNGQDIHTVMDFYRAINDKSKRVLVFLIDRQGTRGTVTLRR